MLDVLASPMIEALESLDGIAGETLAEPLSAGPLLRLHYRGGRPRAASALMLVDAPADLLWEIVGSIDRLPKLIRMVSSVRHLAPTPEGLDVVHVELRFKIAFFGTKFGFEGTRELTGERRVEVRYLRGKVRDAYIDLEVAPVSETQSALRCHVGFDPLSLGWLVKIFLNHHPEIEYGLHTGSVMSIVEAARQAAEKEAAQSASR